MKLKITLSLNSPSFCISFWIKSSTLHNPLQTSVSQLLISGSVVKETWKPRLCWLYSTFYKKLSAHPNSKFGEGRKSFNGWGSRSCMKPEKHVLISYSEKPVSPQTQLTNLYEARFVFHSLINMHAFENLCSAVTMFPMTLLRNKRLWLGCQVHKNTPALNVVTSVRCSNVVVSVWLQ